MLPSFRLIVATFLFGFVLVFAGVRIAANTRIAHNSLPGLTTPAVAAPVILVQVATGGQVMPVAAPLAFVPAADPPRIDLVVPVIFNLNSVIRATAGAPATVSSTPDMTPVPAELAPLTILPQVALRSAPEVKPVPATLAPLTILPEMIASRSAPETTPVPAKLAPLTMLPEMIAFRSAPEAKPVPAKLAPLTILPEVIASRSAPETTPVPAKLAALTVLPGVIALRSAPEAKPVESPDLTLALKPATSPEAKASEPVAAYTPAHLPVGMPAGVPASVEATGPFDPAPSPPVAPGMNALDQSPEAAPVTVWIRLPLAKKPPLAKKSLLAKRVHRAKIKKARVKRPHSDWQAVSRDPFDFLGKRQF